MRNRRVAWLFAVIVVAVIATSCVTGVRAGKRCRTADFGDDGTYVLKCQRGRWVRSATKVQVAQLIIAILRARTTTTTTSTTTTTTTIVTRVGVGDHLSCGLLATGSVKCWGRNSLGQLGNGAALPGADVLAPSPAIGISGATSIALGDVFGCALLGDSTVKCWGYNAFGQLGRGMAGTSSSTPTPVTGLSGVTSVALGYLHACAVVTGGTVKCWGRNSLGQLGNNSTTDSSTPVSVISINNAVSVSLSEYSSCALLSSGNVKCWGRNNDGELGNGTTTNSLTPVDVLLSGATGLHVGYSHACAVLAGAVAKCWGLNTSGQTGNGSTSANESTPVSVPNVNGIVAMAAADESTCALLISGSVTCWGGNSTGQLGNGSNTASLAPVAVSGISSALSIDGNLAHFCVGLSGGSVKCWGANTYGQLGNGTTTDSNVPVAVVGIP